MDPDKFLSAKGDSQLNAIYSLRCFFKFGTDGLYCVTKGNIFLRILVSDEVPTSCL